MKENTLYIIAILCFSLLAYIAWSTWIFWSYLQKSKDLIAATKPFLATGNNLAILVAGDSTALGVGATQPADSIAGRIHQQLPDSSIENFSRSGLKTHQLLPLLKSAPTRKMYDLIILQIGGNDIIQRTPLPELDSDLTQILQHAKTLSPNVILMTSGNVGGAPIFPKPLRVYYRSRTLKVRDLFMNLAHQYNIRYIDFYRHPDEDPFVLHQDTYFAPDYFHPNSQGYGLWYQQIEPVVQELIDR